MTPIAPASFLRYYVSELHRRQTCFTALSAETGHLIRKYETYRAVQRETGALSEILPRILLMIDEYQSLFEGNTETAALLSELVRKGRTYGVHLIMASQRGVSESARNTFTAELKDHFSTRLVFRCPPAAARRLFSDRAVDTGRENTGIAAAVLLKTGHALLNDEAGQTERATVSVQCFYAGDDLIGRMCSLLPRVNGTGETAWLRYNAASRAAPSALPHGEVTFGDSVCLHKDRAASDADSLKDDGLVSFTPNGTHILCTGSNLRVPGLCAVQRRAVCGTGRAFAACFLRGKSPATAALPGNRHGLYHACRTERNAFPSASGRSKPRRQRVFGDERGKRIQPAARHTAPLRGRGASQKRRRTQPPFRRV